MVPGSMPADSALPSQREYSEKQLQAGALLGKIKLAFDVQWSLCKFSHKEGKCQLGFIFHFRKGGGRVLELQALG